MKGPRLDRVEIADFRGIPAAGFGPLKLDGQNLLLIGENGSGKSSIFRAIADLLDLSPEAHPFNANLEDARCLKHRFSDRELRTGHVTLHFTAPAKGATPAAPMRWPIEGKRPTEHAYFSPMARIRGCLDYRAMLRTNFVHEEADGVNLFPLLMGTLLRDIEERGLGKTFGDGWREILDAAAALPPAPLLEAGPTPDDFARLMGAEDEATPDTWEGEDDPPNYEEDPGNEEERADEPDLGEPPNEDAADIENSQWEKERDLHGSLDDEEDFTAGHPDWVPPSDDDYEPEPEPEPELEDPENLGAEGEPELPPEEDWTEDVSRRSLSDPETIVTNRQRAVLSEKIIALNDAIARWLPQIEVKANQFLSGFKSGVEIQLRYDTLLSAPEWSENPQWHESARLHLRATYREKLLEHPATFLNEARLSAIALAIYLAALQLATPTPESGVIDFPRLLVLDDVLLGIDMGNRVPVLDLIQKDFADWQVLLFTHDRVWYEIARQRLKNAAWKHYDLFSVRIGGYEQPMLCEDGEHLARARTYLGLDEVPAGTVRQPCDVKAGAAHVRTQFELTLKRGCTELGVKIAFDPEPRKMAASTFWDALKGHTFPFTPEPALVMRQGRLIKVQLEPQQVPLVPPELVGNIEHLNWVLNPLVHSESAPRFRQEVEDGISAVEALETQIARALRREQETIAPKWELLLRLLKWREKRPAQPAQASR